MRYTWVPPAEKKKREKERKEAAKKRQREREQKKKKELREKSAKKKNATKVKKWVKQNKSVLDSARQMENKIKERENKKLEEKEIKKAKRKIKREKERKLKKTKNEELNKIEAGKAALHKKALKKAKELKYKKIERCHRKKRLKKRIARYKHRYYEEHGGLERLRKYLQKNDTFGSFMIAVSQDYVIKKNVRMKRWWKEALDTYNSLVEKNHNSIICPSDHVVNGAKVSTTVREIMLLKRVNPEVEDNINTFRDDNGRIVAVKTNDDWWAIVLKEPWYVEEKFSICGMNPLSERKTAQWICENLIENDLSSENFKKVILWHNYVIFDGDDDFSFVVGKTENAAINLYMALFKKYEKTDYICFIGRLSKLLVPKWTEKIREKTGWKKLD